MPFSKLLLTYVLTTIVFFAIDLLWLGVLGKNIYQKYLGHLLGDVNWPAAIIFYLLFIIGIFVFAILPGLEKVSLTYAIIYGALFGFFNYMTYEMTNLATLRDWPLPIVFIDILWGMVLTSSVAAVGFLIARWV